MPSKNPSVGGGAHPVAAGIGDGGCRRERPKKFLTPVFAVCAMLACLQLTTQVTADTLTDTTLQGAAQVEQLNQFAA